jgi:hypothetical protein
MKTESKSKINLLLIVGGILLTVFFIVMTIFVAFKESRNEVQGLVYLVAVVLGALWAVIIGQIMENKRRLRLKRLKWSSVMLPCTWERASEIAKSKDAGWSLPTAYELENYPDRPRVHLWVSRKNRYFCGLESNTPKAKRYEIKHLMIVREV